MSLTALAIRLATIRALKGRTYAEERVFDSKIGPVELVAQGEARPVIIVTTDDDAVDITGRDMRAGEHRLELIIEVAVTERVTVEISEGATTEEVGIPATDAGLEATLAIIGWQISKALAADGGEWGDLWRTLVVKVHSIASRRGADDANGVRYAARQYIYSVDHVAEPEPGASPHALDAWGRVLAAMKADKEFSSLGKIIEAEISLGNPTPWEAARGTLGLANDEAGVLGLSPILPGEDVLLREIGLSDGIVINEDSQP